MTKAIDIEATLLAMADPRQAEVLKRFFKTGSGEYGEGDKFAGLKNPQVRLVVREAWRDAPLSEAVELVENKVHEVRLCGLLIMVEQFLQAMKKKDDTTMQRILETYVPSIRTSTTGTWSTSRPSRLSATMKCSTRNGRSWTSG